MDERPFRQPFDWRGPSDGPSDEQFGDVVAATTLDAVAEAAPPERPDALLVGEPYDGAVIGRKGAREGAAAIREQLAATKTHHFDAGPVAGVGDLGDVAALRRIQDGDRTLSVEAVQDRVESATDGVHATGALPVFLGGDNSMTVPNVGPLLDAGSVGVVSLDAHLDCREPRRDAISGTPYRQLHEAGLDAFAVLGARHFETSTAYHDYVRERGAEVVTAEEVGDGAVEAADRALTAVEGVEQLYVNLDCDVLDAAAAPGVSVPTPGGITSRELFRLLRLLAADDRLAGFEVVGCAPRLDDTERTARTAARAVAHVLAAVGASGGRTPSRSDVEAAGGDRR
ncbi:MAG: arginase family protein [Halobacteriales archaeon]